MKHYTNKKTLEVYAYENDEVAKEYDNDYENLVVMTEELFQEYREQRPGHKWSLNGWVHDELLMNEYEAQKRAQTLQQKRDDLHAIETQIKRYERIKDRTETEEQELDALIEQSTVLFREIKAAETEGEAK
ncbi:hypothetical protein MMG00_09810 [Ignatzschineria rhizosphaerae]|uniref:Uncharacterized protein n=1 Tax=Ignatzschineria rhizosphaerae TaxID=2923279 RepID=A0ABY3X0V6_9GAMM|nr:hypothetical protein [Ignatzschineria rhizosphaerae]UNM95515.1 hypothetical protein MMG00_09810 [Ignatzschineria rhizosphaerae]